MDHCVRPWLAVRFPVLATGARCQLCNFYDRLYNCGLLSIVERWASPEPHQPDAAPVIRLLRRCDSDPR